MIFSGFTWRFSSFFVFLCGFLVILGFLFFFGGGLLVFFPIFLLGFTLGFSSFFGFHFAFVFLGFYLFFFLFFCWVLLGVF